MDIEAPVKQGEHTAAVEQASYKWAWHSLVWPLIIVAMYRQHHLNEEVGDLVALVCASSAIGIGYQCRHRAVSSIWPWEWRKIAIVFAISFFFSVLIGVFSAFYLP